MIAMTLSTGLCPRVAPLSAAALRRCTRAPLLKCRAQQQALEDQPSSSGGNRLTDEAGRNFASSLATLGLGATLLSERLNGVGLVNQLELLEGKSLMDPLLIFVIGALLVAAVKPSKPQGGQQQPAAAAAVFNIQDIVGRMSFLGLASTLIAELTTGKGLLNMLHIETGVELSEVEGVLAFFIMLILTGQREHNNPRT